MSSVKENLSNIRPLSIKSRIEAVKVQSEQFLMDLDVNVKISADLFETIVDYHKTFTKSPINIYEEASEEYEKRHAEINQKFDSQKNENNKMNKELSELKEENDQFFKILLDCQNKLTDLVLKIG